jgi:hypothetical protein
MEFDSSQLEIYLYSIANVLVLFTKIVILAFLFYMAKVMAKDNKPKQVYTISILFLCVIFVLCSNSSGIQSEFFAISIFQNDSPENNFNSISTNERIASGLAMVFLFATPIFWGINSGKKEKRNEDYKKEELKSSLKIINDLYYSKKITIEEYEEIKETLSKR